MLFRSPPTGLSVVWRGEGEVDPQYAYDLGSQLVDRDSGYYPEMDLCATCKTNVPVMNETMRIERKNNTEEGTNPNDIPDTPGRKY